MKKSGVTSTLVPEAGRDEAHAHGGEVESNIAVVQLQPVVICLVRYCSFLMDRLSRSSLNQALSVPPPISGQQNIVTHLSQLP